MGILLGGNHKEWPEENGREIHYMEVTMEEYEDWLWEQVLEDGPPQDNDIVWLKDKACFIGVVHGKGNMDIHETKRQLEAL